jgi:hypothetical protein
MVAHRPRSGSLNIEIAQKLGRKNGKVQKSRQTRGASPLHAPAMLPVPKTDAP